MRVRGYTETFVRDVERPRILADDHQGRRHRALDIHLSDGSEGVPRAVVLEQKDRLIEKHSNSYQAYQCLQSF